MSNNPDDVDPFGPGNKRWLNRKIAFIDKDRTFTGTVIAQKYVGRTKVGSIPDWELVVRGSTGKTMTISLVEARSTFPE